jgi:lipopolysaccharide cholinephosphotransferase
MSTEFNKVFPDNRHLGETDLRKAQLIMLRMLKVVDAICCQHNISYWLEAGTLLGAVRHQGFIPWDDDIDISMLRADFERFKTIAPKALPSELFMQTDKTDKGYYNCSSPLKIRDTKSLFVEVTEEEDERVHQGVFIDIFPYDAIPDRTLYLKRKERARRLSKIKRYHASFEGYQKSSLLYKCLAPLVSVKRVDGIIRDYIKEANQSGCDTVGYGYDFCSPLGIFPKDSIFPLTKLLFEDATFYAPGDYQRFLSIKFGDYMQLPPKAEQKPAHLKKFIPEL